jgi:hypothetical protein
VGLSSGVHGEELPLTLDALERPASLINEAEARAGDEVGDGAGHEDLAGSGARCDPGGEVDGDTPHLFISQFDLAGVQPASNLETEGRQPISQGARAADGPSGDRASTGR